MVRKELNNCVWHVVATDIWNVRICHQHMVWLPLPAHMKEKIQFCYFKQHGKYDKFQTKFSLVFILVDCFFFNFTSSYLIKSWDWALQGKTLVPTLNYLSKFVKRKTNQRWDPSITGIIDALQAVAAKYVHFIVCFHKTPSNFT